MKRLLIVPVLLLLSVGMLSCKKETVPDQQIFMQQKNMQNVNPLLYVFGSCDNWRISLFQTNRADLTGNYKSLNLTFCPDNTFVVSNDILSVTGNWYFTLDKGNPIMLILDFNYPADEPDVHRPVGLWAELGGVWQISMLQKNMIRLQTVELAKKMILERGSIY